MSQHALSTRFACHGYLSFVKINISILMPKQIICVNIEINCVITDQSHSTQCSVKKVSLREAARHYRLAAGQVSTFPAGHASWCVQMPAFQLKSPRWQGETN